jgi:non-specific serine/threonine protein kinase
MPKVRLDGWAADAGDNQRLESMNRPAPSATPPASAAPAAVRRFARFELVELIGGSSLSMAWWVRDPRDGAEKVMMAPRVQPSGAGAVERWQSAVQRGGRLDHPALIRPAELGDHQGWPFAIYRPEGRPLSQRLSGPVMPGAPHDVAAMTADLCRALARAHLGGVVHGDLQAWNVWVTGPERVKLMGIEVAGVAGDEAAKLPAGEHRETVRLRELAARDVSAVGVLLNWLLTGRPPLGLTDVVNVLAKLPPSGQELLRLPPPSELSLPIALRVIGNRATDRREAYRYRSAQAMLTALEGFLYARSNQGRSFLQEMRTKLRSVGGLPIVEESREALSKIESLLDERTSSVAELLLDDVSVAVEVLRSVNAAQQRDERRAGSSSVLTLHRAVAMLGLRGVRRVITGMKPWPGALKPFEADAFAQVIEQSRIAARVAQGLRPPGFDAEIVYLVTVLQSLGRLVLHYVFPEQAMQIRSVMAEGGERGGKSGRGWDAEINEETACLAVLGVDMDAITASALQHLGLDDSARTICRRIPINTNVQTTRQDDDLLRYTASCAIEAVDALQWPSDRAAIELSNVLQRYGRSLRIDLRALKRLLLPHGLDGDTLRSWVRRTPGATMDPEDDLL